MQRKIKDARTEEYNGGIGTVKSFKIKEVQIGQKKQAMVCFSMKIEARKAITETKWCEVWNAEVHRKVYNRNSSVKSQIYLKTNKNKIRTQKSKQKEI